MVFTNSMAARDQVVKANYYMLYEKKLLKERCITTVHSSSSYSHTCTILEMSIGSIESGKRKMLNNESEKKAFSASSTLFLSERMYTANVTSETCIP